MTLDAGAALGQGQVAKEPNEPKWTASLTSDTAVTPPSLMRLPASHRFRSGVQWGDTTSENARPARLGGDLIDQITARYA
jgi:hypothetical protein